MRKVFVLCGHTLALFASSSFSTAQASPLPPAGDIHQESTSVSNVGVKPPAQTDEVDQLITNRQLRASTGSLSKISVNATLSYSAGAIDAPFSVVRPNITAAGDTATLQSFAGDAGLRYRLNTKDSINFSVGLGMSAPFHYSLETDNAALRSEFDQNAHVLTVNDPSLTFRHLDKIWGIQSISAASAMLYTAAYRRNAGFQSGLVLSQTMMREFGNSGLSVGAVIQGTVNSFSGDVDSSNRPAFILGFFPSVEYVINDRLNLRTVSGLWVNEFRRNGTSFNRTIYQSVGLGISVMRDIFLYPNIQFLPGDLRADKTNIGFTANLNVF